MLVVRHIQMCVPQIDNDDNNPKIVVHSDIACIVRTATDFPPLIANEEIAAYHYTDGCACQKHNIGNKSNNLDRNGFCDIVDMLRFLKAT